MPTITLKLLHIEDNDGDARMVQRSLAKEFEDGCDIVRAGSLKEGLEKLEAQPFDVVLLNMNFTETGSVGDIRAIQKINPDVPIVILSGKDDADFALKAVRSGAQEYLVKSHSSSRLLGLAVRSSIERKGYERFLYQQVHYDELTGLPNRRMFLDYLKPWLIRAQRWKQNQALMLMDINGFKHLNDALGHHVGDLVLQQVAARLKVGLRASDMLARYAGDEFVVHLDSEGVITPEICEMVALKVIDLFREPIIDGSRHIATGVSIGIAFYPEHGKNALELIQSADKAMYHAKRLKMGYSFAEDTTA